MATKAVFLILWNREHQNKKKRKLLGNKGTRGSVGGSEGEYSLTRQMVLSPYPPPPFPPWEALRTGNDSPIFRSNIQSATAALLDDSGLKIPTRGRTHLSYIRIYPTGILCL